MRDHDRDRDISKELSEETKGLGQQVKGKVKEETGDLLDDRSMEIEGKVEKNTGKARREINNPADAMASDLDRNLGSDRDDRSTTGTDRSGASDLDRGNKKDRSGY